jgi:succinate dehydrogenase / fumarate reductase iron-sulfur subunit
MAEFFLPKNSKINNKPRKHAAPDGAGTNIKMFKIYRYDPEEGGNPRYDTFAVDMDECGPMVLDALIKIKATQDATLTFRRSCREGICGSCSMNIDGTEHAGLHQGVRGREGRGADHAAAAHGRGQGPGAGFHALLRPVRVDQAVAADGDARAFGQGAAAEPEDRHKLDGLYECILCACCSSSCPSYWWNSDRFLGPAILLQAYRWLADSRDEMTGERLDELEDPFRLYRCHTIMNCANVCPKGLNPAKAIAETKKMLVERAV